MVTVEKEQNELIATKKQGVLGITITKAVPTEQLYPSYTSLSRLNVKPSEVEQNPLVAGRKLEAKANFEKLTGNASKEEMLRNLIYATESIRS